MKILPKPQNEWIGGPSNKRFNYWLQFASFKNERSYDSDTKGEKVRRLVWMRLTIERWRRSVIFTVNLLILSTAKIWSTPPISGVWRKFYFFFGWFLNIWSFFSKPFLIWWLMVFFVWPKSKNHKMTMEIWQQNNLQKYLYYK